VTAESQEKIFWRPDFLFWLRVAMKRLFKEYLDESDSFDGVELQSRGNNADPVAVPAEVIPRQVSAPETVEVELEEEPLKLGLVQPWFSKQKKKKKKKKRKKKTKRKRKKQKTKAKRTVFASLVSFRCMSEERLRRDASAVSEIRALGLVLAFFFFSFFFFQMPGVKLLEGCELLGLDLRGGVMKAVTCQEFAMKHQKKKKRKKKRKKKKKKRKKN
jgi:hypothetical protein